MTLVAPVLGRGALSALSSGCIPRRSCKCWSWAERVANALDPVGLELEPGTSAGDLRPSERRLLGAALALMDAPRLLVLDDVDRGLTAGDQRALWERLRALTETTGVTIIASCVDAGPAAGLADLEVTL